jgi:hypothetical protein
MYGLLTKQEAAIIRDPDYLKLPGIASSIAEAQMMGLIEYTFPVPILTTKKVAQWLGSSPYNYAVTTNDTGLPSQQTRIIKVNWA